MKITFFAAFIILGISCKPAGQDSALSAVATAKSVKTGMFLPESESSLVSTSKRPQSSIKTVEEFRSTTGLEFNIDNSNEYYFLSTAMDGEEILFVELKNEGTVFPFASRRGGQTYIFTSQSIETKTHRYYTRIYTKHRVDEEVSPSVSNQYIMRTPDGKSALVPWLSHLQTDSGSMLYKVGGAIYQTGKLRPVLGFEEISTNPSVWRVSGTYEDKEIKSGTYFWTNDKNTYYSVDETGKSMTKYLKQADCANNCLKKNGDSMDRVGSGQVDWSVVPEFLEKRLRPEGMLLSGAVPAAGGLADVAVKSNLVDSKTVYVIPPARVARGKAKFNSSFGLANNDTGETIIVPSRSLDHVRPQLKNEYDRMAKANYGRVTFTNARPLSIRTQKMNSGNVMVFERQLAEGSNGRTYVVERRFTRKQGKRYSTGPSQFVIQEPAEEAQEARQRLARSQAQRDASARHLASSRKQSEAAMKMAEKSDEKTHKTFSGAMTSVVGSAGIQSVKAISLGKTHNVAAVAAIGAGGSIAKDGLHTVVGGLEAPQTVSGGGEHHGFEVDKKNLAIETGKYGLKAYTHNALHHSTRALAKGAAMPAAIVVASGVDAAQGKYGKALDTASTGGLSAASAGGLGASSVVGLSTVYQGAKEINQQGQTWSKYSVAKSKAEQTSMDYDTALYHSNMNIQASSELEKFEQVVQPAPQRFSGPEASGLNEVQDTSRTYNDTPAVQSSGPTSFDEF